ncbi:MAG: glycosyltransferase, partial [Limnospira sp. PMC 1293.21]|uniref:glycosyltransferase n=1 Tax=Limnospira sp. PMC 1293.21 TaxID=2981076 RepID=UPI0028E1345B
RGGEIRCHTIRVEDEGRFVEQALGLVLAHFYEVVHLSKPRMPNIVLGLLYKLVWGARVIVDIDDEELAFVKAEGAVDLREFLESGEQLPQWWGLDGRKWTQIAVGLAREFDGVTVSNPALQERYGGVVIRHARDEGRFVPSEERRLRSRERLGIARDKKVVLFFGTPKEHKGLVATAEALAGLGRGDVVFAIVGDFTDAGLKERLLGISGVEYVFVGNQPFDEIPDVVAAGDICVLLQDGGSPVSQFQTPAKLSDALGMGLVVLLSETAAVADVIESGAVVPVAEGDLPAVLGRVLSDEAECNQFRVRGRELLAAEFGFGVNGSRLAAVMDEVRSGVGVLSDELNLLLAGFPAVGSVWQHWGEGVLETRRLRPVGQGVSIIVLSWNGAGLLRRLLSSFFATNTYFPVEFIIIDHGSEDNTAEVVRQQAVKGDVRYINRGANFSFSDSCNYGAGLAKHPYLLFLNNDIVFSSDVLPLAVSRLDDATIGAVGVRLDDEPSSLPKGKEPGVQHTGIEFVWNERRGYFQPEQIRHGSLKDYLANATAEGDFFPAVTGAFLLCRKGDWERVSGFSLDYDYGLEDIDFCLRLGRDLQKKCYCINQVSLQHQEGATRQKGNQPQRRQVRENNHQVFKLNWSHDTKILVTNQRIIVSPILSPKKFDTVNSFEDILHSTKPLLPAWINDNVRKQAQTIVEQAKPDISVIIPTWNRGSIILRAIKSAFQQTIQPFEVIVIDDGSTDNTITLLQKYFATEILQKKLRIIQSNHQGVSNARNIGLQNAKGNLIAYLDSDNYWHQDHLLYTTAALYKQNATSVYSATNVKNITKSYYKVLCKKYDREQMLRSNFIDLNSFIHRIEMYKLHGGFDETLTRLVDWELIIRYTADGRCVLVPLVTVEYFLEEKSLNNITFSEPLDENANRVFLKHSKEYIERGILTQAQIDTKGADFHNQNSDLSLSINKKISSQESSQVLTLYIVRYNNSLDYDFLDKIGLYKLDVKIEYFYLDDDYNFIYQDHEKNTTITYNPSDLPKGVYWYPDIRQPLPVDDQLRALTFAVGLIEAVDVAVLSYNQNVDKTFDASCIRNQIMTNEKLISYLVKPSKVNFNFMGKLLRIPPKQGQFSHQVELEKIFGITLNFDSKNQLFYPSHTSVASPINRCKKDTKILKISKQKDRVLVLPMKLAVGGVERNTVEVIRFLKDKYDFIWVTMEKIYSEQGSLAGQAMDVCWRLIDMAEITNHSCYLDFLKQLKEAYQPDIIWICNGSMWFCANAIEIRKLFLEIPIIDQQVYDVNQGWIKRYHEKGIQSFDRFIAINSKIYRKFIDDLKMDEEKVDLIYHCIDSNKFIDLKLQQVNIQDLRRHFNLPQGKLIFVFMGRLVEQKRPQHFIEISRLRRSNNDEHYVIVGNGMLAPQVQQCLKEHDATNIQWIPYISDVPQFWQAVDGMIITSAYEGLPIAMLEALAMGVPVLATDVGDISLVIKRHNAGIVVNSNSTPADIAIMISDWKQKIPDYRLHLKTESDRILERFSVSQIAAQYVDCWERARKTKIL